MIFRSNYLCAIVVIFLAVSCDRSQDAEIAPIPTRNYAKASTDKVLAKGLELVNSAVSQNVRTSWPDLSDSEALIMEGDNEVSYSYFLSKTDKELKNLVITAHADGYRAGIVTYTLNEDATWQQFSGNIEMTSLSGDSTIGGQSLSGQRTSSGYYYCDVTVWEVGYMQDGEFVHVYTEIEYGACTYVGFDLTESHEGAAGGSGGTWNFSIETGGGGGGDGDVGIPTCGEGMVWNGTQCLCPMGYEKIGDECLEVCERGFDRNEANQCVPMEKPCLGNPVPAPEVAAQSGSGIMGGMFGCTRYGSGCADDNTRKGHGGIDLKADYGDPIYAMYDGTAQRLTQYNDDGEVDGAGYYVRITSTIDGETVQISYFHLQQAGRMAGAVQAGDIIGYQGVSGNLGDAINNNLTVSHVHVQTKINGEAVPPTDYLSTFIDSETGEVLYDPDCNE